MSTSDIKKTVFKIFISSSTENYYLANHLKCIIEAVYEREPKLKKFKNEFRIEIRIWDKVYQEEGGTSQYFETLVKVAPEFDAAFFILENEDKVFSRGEELETTRGNVWIEFGLLYTFLGNGRVKGILSYEAAEKITAPSNYSGLGFTNYTLGKLDEIDSCINVLKDIYGNNKRNEKSYSEIKNDINIDTELITNKQVVFSRNYIELKEAIIATIHNKVSGAVNMRYYDDRDECFALGEQIIKNANEFIYSSISFESDGSLLTYILEKVRYEKANGNKKFEVKRWINVEKPGLFKEALDLLEADSGIIVKHLYNRFLEVVISEKEALIVIPGSKEDQVGHGIYTKRKNVIQDLKRWFLTHLPSQSTRKIDITQGHLNNIIDYLIRLKNVRNSYSSIDCFAHEKDITEMENNHVLSEFRDKFISLSKELKHESRDICILGMGKTGDAISSGLKSLCQHFSSNGNSNCFEDPKNTSLPIRLLTISKDEFLNYKRKNIELHEVIYDKSIVFLCLREDNFTDEIRSLITKLEEKKCTLLFIQHTFPKSIKYKPQFHIHLIPNINVKYNNGYTIVLRNNRNKDYNYILALLISLGDYFEVTKSNLLSNYSLISGVAPFFYIDIYEKLIEAIHKALDIDRAEVSSILDNISKNTQFALEKIKHYLLIDDYKSSLFSENSVVEEVLNENNVIIEENIKEIYSILKI